MKTTASPSRRLGLFAIAAVMLLCAAALFGFGRHARSAGVTATALTPSCPPSNTPGAHDYSQLTLTMCNFSSQDLTNANFAGAKLTAVMFIRTNLTKANFNGATFVDSGNPAFPNDLTYATLTGATFDKAQFNGITYLSYAKLGCAAFTNTDISTGNAVFGDAPLLLAADTSACRTSFAGATMNCEFVAQWPLLDLTGANIAACSNQIATAPGAQNGFDFSGAVMPGVTFDNLDLSHSKWTGAVLTGASFQHATLDYATGLNGVAGAATSKAMGGIKFNQASVQYVDMSYAQLYGADFTEANLSNSSLSGASLVITSDFTTVAQFNYASLKHANLSNAKLAGASFRFASFYTSTPTTPTFPCPTDVKNACPALPNAGFTCNCAVASGADLSGADFTNAYLAGTDFSGTTTKVNGTVFSSAVLVGASFGSVSFQTDGGKPPNYTSAFMQGVIFDATATLDNATMTGAFFDFGNNNANNNNNNPNCPNLFANGTGNSLSFALPNSYTKFRRWSGSPTPCVSASYNYTAVPATKSLNCPDGTSGICGAGKPAPNANAHWASGTAIVSAPVPGWYLGDATYDNAPCPPLPLTPVEIDCGNGTSIDPNW